MPPIHNRFQAVRKKIRLDILIAIVLKVTLTHVEVWSCELECINEIAWPIHYQLVTFNRQRFIARFQPVTFEIFGTGLV